MTGFQPDEGPAKWHSFESGSDLDPDKTNNSVSDLQENLSVLRRWTMRVSMRIKLSTLRDKVMLSHPFQRQNLSYGVTEFFPVTYIFSDHFYFSPIILIFFRSLLFIPSVFICYQWVPVLFKNFFLGILTYVEVQLHILHI